MKSSPCFSITGTPKQSLGYSNLTALIRYTIICYDQHDNPNNKEKRIRKFHSITPPDVPFGENQIERVGEYNRVCIYISNLHPKSKTTDFNHLQVAIGLCSVDVSTGVVGVHEAQSLALFEMNALNEAYRFLQATNPIKITLVYRGFTLWTPVAVETFHRAVCSKLNVDLASDVTSPVRVSVLLESNASKLIDMASKTEYQYQTLKKVYSVGTAAEAVIDGLLRSHPFAVSALVLDFDDLYATNPNVLTRMRLPNVWQNNQTLVLAYNAVRQLDLVRGLNETVVQCTCSASKCIAEARRVSRRHEYLSDILDYTCTGLGQRKLFRWIKCPSCNPLEIESRLNGVTWFIQHASDKGSSTNELRELLKQIKVDIVRVVRTSSIRPKHISALVKSLRPTLAFFDCVVDLKKINGLNYPSDNKLTQIREFIRCYDETFDDEIMSGLKAVTGNFDEIRIMRPGNDDTVDQLFQEIDEADQVIIEYVCFANENRD